MFAFKTMGILDQLIKTIADWFVRDVNGLFVLGHMDIHPATVGITSARKHNGNFWDIETICTGRCKCAIFLFGKLDPEIASRFRNWVIATGVQYEAC